MKTCTHCLLDKDISEFSKKKSTSDGLQYICKECHSLYLKGHYLNNKNYYKSKAIIRNKKVKPQLLQYAINYLKKNPCIDCGEHDPLVLEFDHVRGQKSKAISDLIGDGVSEKRLQEEIEKCEVRCCNCHRRKTAKQLGWYKDILI